MIPLLPTVFVATVLIHPPPNWGKISPEERAFEPPDAEQHDAVVLSDRAELGWFLYIQHKRIKILTKMGASEHSSVEIPDWPWFEIADIKAQTILADGRKIPVKDFFHQGIDELRTMRFTFPAVEPGAILEYSYEARTFDFPSFYFQSDLYTRMAEFHVQDWLPLPLFGTGIVVAVPRAVEERYSRMWRLENVVALKEEPEAPPLGDFRTGIHFATHREHLAEWYKEYKKEFTKKPQPAEKWLQERVAGLTEPRAKAEVVYKFLRDDLTAPSGDEYAKSVAEVVQKRKGTRRQRNMALLFFLERLGLPVDPVMIQPRDEGRLRLDYADLLRLERLIVRTKIGDEVIYLDANEPLCPFGQLPLDDHVKKGLAIMGDTTLVLELGLPRVSSTRNYDSAFSLDAAGALRGATTISYTGFERFVALQRLGKSSEKDLALDLLRPRFPAIVLGDVAVTGRSEADTTLVIKAAYEVPSYADLSSGRCSAPMPWLAPLETAAFTAEQRVLPIDLRYPHKYSETAVATFPQGWHVGSTPKSAWIVRGALSYRLRSSATGDSLRVTREIEVREARIEAEQYSSVQGFHGQVVTADAGQFVIEGTAQ